MSDHYTRLHDYNEYIGSGYDLWTNTTLSYEGAGLYSSDLWAKEALEKIKELEDSDSPWLLQVSFTSSSPRQAPDTFMALYDNQTTSSKVISSVREREGNSVGTNNSNIQIFE